MANSLIQFRDDDTAKLQAIQILEQLGIDLPTYLRMCIARLNLERGIPFSMKLEDSTPARAIQAMQEASRIAESNGTADMTLDDINAEIAAARG